MTAAGDYFRAQLTSRGRGRDATQDFIDRYMTKPDATAAAADDQTADGDSA